MSNIERLIHALHVELGESSPSIPVITVSRKNLEDLLRLIETTEVNRHA